MEFDQMKKSEENRLKNEDKQKFREIKKKQHEFMVQLNKDRMDEEEKEFKKYLTKKEKLKQQRIKAFFDAEY